MSITEHLWVVFAESIENGRSSTVWATQREKGGFK